MDAVGRDDHPTGRKSHADFSLGGGMPAVSGELYISGVPTPPGFANDPGVVPSRPVEGLSPNGGSVHERSATSSAVAAGRDMRVLLQNRERDGAADAARVRQNIWRGKTGDLKRRRGRRDGVEERQRDSLPYAGVNRIRFQGSALRRPSTRVMRGRRSHHP
jgi:hypothetical protein